MSTKEKEIKQEVNPFGDFALFTGKTTPKQTVEKQPKVEQTEEGKNAELEAKLKAEEETKKLEEEKLQKEQEELERKKAEAEDKSTLKPLVEKWRKDGLLDIDDKDLEEFDDSIEALDKFQEKTINKRVEKTITDYKTSFPEDAQKFLEFVEAGGDPKVFHQIYYETGSFADFDISTEENQKHAIAEGLRLSGIEDEKEIEDEIQLLEDAGKLESKAKFHLDRLKKYEANQKEQLLLSQKALKERQIENNKKQIEELKKSLFDKKELQGFPVTDKIKNDLWEFMTKPDKTGKTGLQKSYEENKDAQFMYAYLAMRNWDIESLKKGVRTEVTSDLKKKLGNYTDNRSKLKGTTEYNKQEMEEKTKGDFSGFKTLLGQNK